MRQQENAYATHMGSSEVAILSPLIIVAVAAVAVVVIGGGIVLAINLSSKKEE